jgi:hypothetical protein
MSKEVKGWPATVKILGRQHATVEPSFGVGELLFAAVGGCTPSESDLRFLFALSAVIGHCTGIGAAAKRKLAGMEYDVLRYGEAVYSHIRKEGASMAEVSRVGNELVEALQALVFPLETEVAAAADFSEGTGAPT